MLFYLLLALLILVVGFLIWPSPIDPQDCDPQPIPALAGPYERNDRLDKLEKIYENQCVRCEDVAIDTQGVLYGGQENGDIIRMDGDEVSTIANTGGRPLGLDFDGDRLIIADAYAGLIQMSPDGDVEVLSTEADGLPFRFADDIEVGPDGRYYFSDASSKYQFHQTMLDIVEHGGHGRLLVYDPETRETEMLLDGLQFANGVAVAQDTSYVLVNETGSQQVRKFHLSGPKKGTDELIMDNLPGYPDNVSSAGDGTYWLTLVSPRSTSTDDMMRNKWLRKQLMKVPSILPTDMNGHYGHIMRIDGDGNILENYQSDHPPVYEITSIQQYGDHIYVGSLKDNGIGKMKISKI